MVVLEALTRPIERSGIAMTQLGLPVTPVAAVVLVVQRAEQRVVLQPPAFTLEEGPELLAARRAGAAMPIAKDVERQMERQPLERAHRAEVHGVAPPDCVEPRPIDGVERCPRHRLRRTPGRRAAR